MRGDPDSVYPWYGTSSRPGWPVALAVGEAPNRSSAPDRPLVGGSLWRLLIEAGVKPADWLRTFGRTNLLDACPGRPWGKKEWALARARAEQIRTDPRWRVVLLFGRQVEAAFGERYRFYEWRDSGDKIIVTFPHFSGRSTVWNDPEARAAFSEKLDMVMSCVDGRQVGA